MSDPTDDRVHALFAATRAQIDREQGIYEVLHELAGLVRQLNTELGEVRDDMVALSNRLEAVTRTVGGGLHSVKS